MFIIDLVFEFNGETIKKFSGDLDIAGIYAIKHLKTNKIYIGKTTCIKDRLFDHLKILKNNKHHNKRLQYLFNNSSRNEFVFLVLERSKTS